MKKILALCACFILCGLLFSGCSSQKLADGFDEQKVTKRAAEIIDVINTLDYDAITKCVREDLQEQLSAETLEQAWGEQLYALGAFQEIQKTIVTGSKSKTTDEDYAVAVSVCSYENGAATFTIVLDLNYDVVGLYMK